MKKKRKRLTKQEREQIIRSLSQNKSTTTVEAKMEKSLLISENSATTTELVDTNKEIYRELRKIVIVSTIIIVIFVAIVIVDQKTSYLDVISKIIVDKLQI